MNRFLYGTKNLAREVALFSSLVKLLPIIYINYTHLVKLINDHEFS